ncbi:MAG: fluoride efflux transporter CrcB [Dehalococcoidia bacterium]|nr:fluoride efflux transporter CrcB [Dehalococcoidia bacterium]
MTWFNVLLVAVGGSTGAVCRYAVGLWMPRIAGTAAFPWATVAVNMSGCLAIGLILGLSEHRHIAGSGVRLIAVIGFLGGFTTFSAFGYETLILLREGRNGAALANITLQPAFGLAAAALGWWLSRLGQ